MMLLALLLLLLLLYSKQPLLQALQPGLLQSLLQLLPRPLQVQVLLWVLE
jgi:hypothetical protein